MPGKTKIANFNSSIFHEENIVRLDIPMKNFTGMYFLQPIDDLIKDGFSHIFGQHNFFMLGEL